MALSVQAFATALRAGELSHDGDSTLEAHVANCRRQDTNMFDEDHRPLYILQKDHPNSPRKIDAAVASVLAWECRGDAIAAGVRATSDSLNGATFHAF
jgi:phage terminase large subunit-like protein